LVYSKNKLLKTFYNYKIFVALHHQTK